MLRLERCRSYSLHHRKASQTGAGTFSSGRLQKFGQGRTHLRHGLDLYCLRMDRTIPALCDHSTHGRSDAFLWILRFLTKISAYVSPRLFLAYCEYSLTSQIRRCFRETARVDCNHPLYKRCTRCRANHPKFLRTFSQKGASQHCKFLVPYCMIHTMNGRLSQEA